MRTLAVSDSGVVFQTTQTNDANFGLVPADDTSAGLFSRYPLLICGEVILPGEDGSGAERFLVIGKQQIRPSGDDKTTLLITDDRQQQARLLDIQGHQSEPETAAQIAYHQSRVEHCKCLGYYPSNVL